MFWRSRGKRMGNGQWGFQAWVWSASIGVAFGLRFALWRMSCEIHEAEK